MSFKIISLVSCNTTLFAIFKDGTRRRILFFANVVLNDGSSDVYSFCYTNLKREKSYLFPVELDQAFISYSEV